MSANNDDSHRSAPVLVQELTFDKSKFSPDEWIRVNKAASLLRGWHCRKVLRKDLRHWHASYKMIAVFSENERRYLADIEILYKYFYDPMCTRSGFAEADLHTFLPLLSKLRRISHDVCTHLELYLSHPIGQLMGVALAAIPPMIMGLGAYAFYYGDAIAALYNLRKRKEFMGLLKAVQQDDRSFSTASVEKLLARPLHRVPTYLLLFEALRDIHPPWQMDSLQNLVSAIEMLKNEMQDFEVIEKQQADLSRIQSLLSGKLAPLPLTGSGRFLVHSGTMTIRSGRNTLPNRALFLLNHQMILTRGKNKTGQYEVESVYRLTDVSIANAPDGIVEHLRTPFYLSLAVAATPFILGLLTEKELILWSSKFASLGIGIPPETPDASPTKSLRPHMSIHEASAGLDVGALMALLDHGEDIRSLDDQGQSPLHIAVINGNQDMIMTILSLDVDVDLLDRSRRTPLHIAAMNGRPDVVGVLCDHGAIVNVPDGEGRTALLLACELAPPKALVETIEELLQNGADPSVGAGAVAWALLTREPGLSDAVLFPIFDNLLNRGFNANLQHDVHCSLLHLASQAKLEKVAKRLLQAGCYPNTCSSDGSTALHLKGSSSMGVLLASHGARPSITNKAGRPASVDPADYAALSRFSTLRHKDVCKSPHARPVLNRSKAHWVTNDHSDLCMLCRDRFTLTVRRHHCRYCGLLVCAQCSSMKVNFLTKAKECRVCDGCFNLLYFMAETGKTTAPTSPEVSKTSSSIRLTGNLEEDLNLVTTFDRPTKMPREPSLANEFIWERDRDELLPAEALAKRDQKDARARRAAQEFNELMADATVKIKEEDAAAAKQALIERGEKLRRLQERMEQMQEDAQEFGDLAAKLAEKQRTRFF